MQIRKPILDRITTLENLPTLPHILLKLIKACDEDKENLRDIAKIIEKDTSLTGKARILCLKIGQRWPEDEMYKWGSYFGLAP